MLHRFSRLILSGAVLLGFAGGASAQQPVDYQMGFQPSATPVMEQVSAFNDGILIAMTAVVIVVLALLLWVIIKYNKGANPEPRRFSHNTLVEVIWTGVPILILLVIAIPSFKLLKLSDEVPEADLTIKAIGYQWYWEYQYPDHGDFGFVANMLTDEEAAAAGEPRKLAVDNKVVVPVNSTVRIITTATDVIHAWTIPSFGIKIDAVPGRLNETWFNATKEGVFYGQCSELCGIRHAFMPIAVDVVSEAEFQTWVDSQRALAGLDPMYVDDVKLASADAANAAQ